MGGTVGRRMLYVCTGVDGARGDGSGDAEGVAATLLGSVPASDGDNGASIAVLGDVSCTAEVCIRADAPVSSVLPLDSA